MVKLRHILICMGVLLLTFGAGCLCGRRNSARNTPVPRVDTLLVRDTIVDHSPQGTAIPAGYELVPVGKMDCYEDMVSQLSADLYKEQHKEPVLVHVHDTTYIAVPLTKTTFTDDKTYKCEVLGYDTKMLWHESYQETAYITKTVAVPTLPKLAVSPDFSAFATRTVFGLGAGLRLDVWRGNWRFSPSLGYALVRDSQQWSYGPVATFSANYNIVLK